MMLPENIQKINYYAKKEKEEGLTPDEKREQVRLRQEYIDSFKAGLRSKLENTVFVDPSGKETTIRKKKKK